MKEKNSPTARARGRIAELGDSGGPAGEDDLRSPCRLEVFRSTGPESDKSVCPQSYGLKEVFIFLFLFLKINCSRLGEVSKISIIVMRAVPPGAIPLL